ncbi:MAG: hypothetical protein U5L45_13570 [Saprospiraceae bacterium]|nr:hypothetical protein [Saprospiraceae bacterium]
MVSTDIFNFTDKNLSTLGKIWIKKAFRREKKSENYPLSIFWLDLK